MCGLAMSYTSLGRMSTRLPGTQTRGCLDMANRLYVSRSVRRSANRGGGCQELIR